MKHPPYSKIVKKNNPDVLHIFAGALKWDWAQRNSEARGCAVVLPDINSFNDYQWPVKNRMVFIFDLEMNRKKILEFAGLLMQQGARDVIVDQQNQGRRPIYVTRQQRE